MTPEKETYTINENEAIDINCRYNPSNLTAEDFTWTASDPEILSVYWDRVRGLKPGTAYIIVKSLDGTYETRIKVVVNEDTSTKMTVQKQQVDAVPNTTTESETNNIIENVLDKNTNKDKLDENINNEINLPSENKYIEE